MCSLSGGILHYWRIAWPVCWLCDGVCRSFHTTAFRIVVGMNATTTNYDDAVGYSWRLNWHQAVCVCVCVLCGVCHIREISRKSPMAKFFAFFSFLFIHCHPSFLFNSYVGAYFVLPSMRHSTVQITHILAVWKTQTFVRSVSLSLAIPHSLSLSIFLVSLCRLNKIHSIFCHPYVSTCTQKK